MKKIRVAIDVFVFFIVLTGTLTGTLAEETVYSGNAIEEKTISADGISYTIHSYADYSGVRLSSNEYGSIIIESIGSSVVYGQYTYTLNDIIEETDAVYFAININKEENSNIDSSRSSSNYNPVPGERVDVIISLKNKGGTTAHVTYTENLPSEVTLIGTPEITKGTSTQTQQNGFSDIYYKGVLYSGEEAEIHFIVEVDRYPSDGSKIISFDDYSFTYKDTYNNLFIGHVDPFKFTLGDPLTVSIDAVNAADVSDISVGDEVEYTLFVKNNVDSTIYVDSLFVSLSSGLDIIEASVDLKETDDGMLWSGDLQSRESTKFYVIVSPVGGGTHTLTADAMYRYTGETDTYTTSDSSSFSLNVVDIVPKIELNSGGTYDGGEDIIIQYTIDNSDKSVSYSNEDITISTDSDLFETLYYIISIPAKSNYLIKKQNFTAPYSDKELTYKITMEGTYGGSTFKESKALIINPSTFSVPYVVEYTVNGVDELYTNITMNINLLTSMASKPDKLAVVHTAENYKKTVSLTTDQIVVLFVDGTMTRNWSIPTSTFIGNETELATQLQYEVYGTTYYKSGSITIPIYEEIAEVAEIFDINDTIEVNATVDVENATVENLKESLVITGEKEQTTKKWMFFILVLFTIGIIAQSLRYFIRKKKKENARKHRIEQISGQETNIILDKKSFFEKAKDIVIHDVPTPKDGYNKLESYLHHMINQGKTNEEIKKILLTKGWIEDVIDSYLRQLR